MEDEKFSLSGTFQKGKEYIDTQLKLLKLKALAKGSRIIGSLVLDIVKIVFVLFIFFFLSLALGFYLGVVLNSYALGFLSSAVIFLLIVLLIRLCESKLKAILMNITIRKVAEMWQGEEDKDTAGVAETTEDNVKSNVHEEFTENK